MRALKELLPRTWYAFLARHPKPRPIQALSAEDILNGADVLLASATASGKTEAYMAPLMERWFDDARSGIMRIMVVSPTKALTNDLERRLAEPLRRCGAESLLRTGDHPQPLAGVKAGVLLTTLESVDSLLARHPRDLGDIRAVVLDELHVVDGTARGDQLIFLMERLRRVVEGLHPGVKLQCLAATATAAFMEDTARKYLGADAKVIKSDTSRGIDLRICSPGLTDKTLASLFSSQALMLADNEGDSDIDDLRDFTAEFAENDFTSELIEACRDTKAVKVLAFVPSRADAETWAQHFRGRPPFYSAVMVHHGSLSREEREKVEASFLKFDSALCFATSTLEVGIDIGDVDMVLLMGPSPDVSSFLQRIGRGGRRKGACKVLAVLRYAGEKERMRHLAECARANKLLASPKPFRSSVLVQQSFSLCYQNPRHFITAEALHSRVPESLRAKYSAKKCQELLEHLADNDFFIADKGNKFKPSEKLLNLFERGRIHHNISAQNYDRVSVVDADTGRIIGEITQQEIDSGTQSFCIGGQSRKIVANHGDVVSMKAAGTARAKFKSLGTAEITYEYAQDLAIYLGIVPGTIPFYITPRYVYYGHFLGTFKSKVLGALLSKKKNSLCTVNPFWVSFIRGADWPADKFTPSAIEKAMQSNAKTLASAFGLGPWSSYLPKPWLYDDLFSFINPQQFAGELAALRPVTCTRELFDIIVTLNNASSRL
ncbi:MAG: DEAD/DEAH box helicase [bacterium]|nr:DEAD/DEAH box helicase [bacterium]